MTLDFTNEFASALSYAHYLATGTDEQKRRWTGVYEAASLTEPQRTLLGGFVRQMNVLVISGIWCGDCVQQIPLLQRIAEANPAKMALRIVDRDQHRELTNQFHINAGDRVPVAIFLAEDFEFCSAFGDRTLAPIGPWPPGSLARACPIGIVPPDSGELSATLADWLNEFERVQLMLRLSARLRKLHGD